MKFPWFKRIGIVFIPANLIGWIILIIGIAYAGHVFIEIDNRSHSVSDTLMNFVFNLLIIGIVYSLIAFLTSWKSKNKS
jgi:membrane protein DedA with SNARE-associated domain